MVNIVIGGLFSYYFCLYIVWKANFLLTEAMTI